MKRAALLCMTLLLLFGMTACASGPAESGSAGGEESSAAEPESAREETAEESPPEAPEEGDSPVQSEPGEPTPDAAEPDSASPSEQELTLSVDGTTLEVSWEDNETVRELMACAAEGSITVNTSLYGGFEQVGSLPRQFSRNDVQMTTAPGDIVLYSGDQLVLFFGSNSWSYTKLGHIDSLTTEELTGLLGGSSAEVEISLN